MYIGSPDSVFKTTNGGIDWINVKNFGTIFHDTIPNVKLSFAPEDENIIYAAVTTRGIFKTTDGGITWEEKNNGLTSKNISVFLSNPKNLNQYFIGTVDSGGQVLFVV